MSHCSADKFRKLKFNAAPKLTGKSLGLLAVAGMLLLLCAGCAGPAQATASPASVPAAHRPADTPPDTERTQRPTDSALTPVSTGANLPTPTPIEIEPTSEATISARGPSPTHQSEGEGPAGSGVAAGTVGATGGAAETDAEARYEIGDGRVGTAPRQGWIFSCATEFRGGGAQHAGDWIDGDYWTPDGKIAVAGSVAWPNASISVEASNGRRLISGNGLPVGEVTGNFPVSRNDPAYQYDTNPNEIQAQPVELSLPLDPVLAAEPSCVPMGMIGITLTGVAIFNGLDAAGRDAVAHEIQDRCSGHPERDGQYHYHGPSDCDPDAVESPHALAGYALDGFGIFGVKDEQGNDLTNADLDECHGHTHLIDWNGSKESVYHYHLTKEYPYTVGCFRGSEVTRLQLAPPGQQGQALQPPPPTRR